MSKLVILLILFVVAAIVFCVIALIAVRFFGSMIDRLEEWAHDDPGDTEGLEEPAPSTSAESGRDVEEDEDAKVLTWVLERIVELEEAAPRVDSETVAQVHALLHGDAIPDGWGNPSWEFSGLFITEPVVQRLRTMGLEDRVAAIVESRRTYLEENEPGNLWILQRELGEPHEEPPHPHWVEIMETIGEERIKALWKEVDRRVRETALEMLACGADVYYLEEDLGTELREEKNFYYDELRREFYPELEGDAREHLEEEISYRFVEADAGFHDWDDVPDGPTWFKEIEFEVMDQQTGQQTELEMPQLSLELNGYGLTGDTGVSVATVDAWLYWIVGSDYYRRPVLDEDVAVVNDFLEWAAANGPGDETIVERHERYEPNPSSGVVLVDNPDSEYRMLPIYGFPIGSPPKELLDLLEDIASRPFVQE